MVTEVLDSLDKDLVELKKPWINMKKYKEKFLLKRLPEGFIFDKLIYLILFHFSQQFLKNLILIK